MTASRKSLRSSWSVLLPSFSLALSLLAMSFNGTAEGGKVISSPQNSCIPDSSNANACQKGKQSACPNPASDSDFYCPNAQPPGTCDPDPVHVCQLSLNVPCGHKFSCKDYQPLPGPGGEEFDACSGGPDVCVSNPGGGD